MIDVVEIHNLTKKFTNPDITALENVSFSLPKGKVIGLVGPDGAGKTTL
ncbi:MAG: ATP-binding cassette domain-containing protein, partial [Alphaproteobacteria bacterium]